MFVAPALRDKNGGAMASVDVMQAAASIEEAIKYRGVLAALSALVQEAIDSVHSLRHHVGALRSGEKRSLQQRCQQRRADALAGNIRHYSSPAGFIHFDDIVVIAAYLVGSHARSRRAEPAGGWQSR